MQEKSLNPYLEYFTKIIFRDLNSKLIGVQDYVEAAYKLTQLKPDVYVILW